MCRFGILKWWCGKRLIVLFYAKPKLCILNRAIFLSKLSVHRSCGYILFRSAQVYQSWAVVSWSVVSSVSLRAPLMNLINVTRSTFYKKDWHDFGSWCVDNWKTYSLSVASTILGPESWPFLTDVWCIIGKQVVVKREEGKVEVHIACINRPGLLVDIMGALDSKRITVLHARIACRQNVLFEALTIEVRVSWRSFSPLHIYYTFVCKHVGRL